ncbi:MAG: transcriptional regulator [Treponema sp.]|nr:transcriptional regulator [Treponema sp.]
MPILTETQETPSHKPQSNRDQRVKYLRLTRIVEFIKNHPNQATAPIMAKKFEVTDRTIQRDIERLNDDYNAEIIRNPRTNLYHLENPAFMLQNALIPEGEIVAVTAILPLLERYKGSPMEKHLINAYTTISNILPNEIEAPLSMVSDIQFISEPIANIETEVFEAVYKATKEHRIINFDYKKISATVYSPHQAEPYKIYNQKGDWYCVCYYRKKDSYVTFTLARMKNISLGEEYIIDKNYDKKVRIDPNFGIWNNLEEPFTVELEFSKDINTYILERTWHKNQTCLQNDDGSVYLKFETNQKQELKFWILRFGPQVKVRSPQWLKEEIKTAALETAALY